MKGHDKRGEASERTIHSAGKDRNAEEKQNTHPCSPAAACQKSQTKNEPEADSERRWWKPPLVLHTRKK